jgi:hypothetical protein
MNKMYGITGLKVRLFNSEYDLNSFLKRYYGDIVDIQYQRDEHYDRFMVVYTTEE